MGWFEEQVNKRKKLDEQTFEDSFLSLAGISSDKEDALSEQARLENFAISQILSYYRYSMSDMPNRITVLKDKINYALRSYEIQYHTVELTENFLDNNASPLLAFAKSNKAPVVLLPRGQKGYYYVSYQTGKKIRFDPSMLHRLESEAFSFYRPLPKHQITVKEYARYIRQSLRPVDTLLFLLLAIAVSGVGLLLPYLTKLLTGTAVQGQAMDVFIATSIYVVAAATGLLLLKAMQGFINSRITIKREKAVQEATMMRLLSLPPSFFKKFNTGELTSRFNSVPQLASTIINGVFSTFMALIMSLAYLFQLVSFASSLVLPVILILLATSGFTVFTAFIQKGYTRKVLEYSSKEAGITYEVINGIQKIRLSGSEKRVFAKWANAYSRSARVKYRPPLLLRLAPAINLLITLLGNLAIYAIASTQKIDVPDYMAFVTSFGVLSGAFASLSSMVTVLSSIQPLFEMARPILTAEPENVQDKKPIEDFHGNITLDNVCFQYQENGPAILDHLNLEIKEGEYIAIVGPTGCGKSTFVRLLLGFEKPTNGNIYVDGVDIEELDLASLRRNIGTVMQNGSLFHADILSNIIISAPNLSEEDAWAAARIADIAKDINAMPMKMHTVISEGQGGISGGQKQRIMIARAIVHKPKVLIFDEATSALDNKTQKSISDSIAKLNCTRIVIAHRLSTIKHADRILMLEGGKIIESGDYNTLIERKGRFAELVERQRLDTK